MAPEIAEPILWSNTLGYDKAIPARVEAAAAAGFRHLSVTVHEMPDGADGVDAVRTFAAGAEAQGVRLSVLDGVITWLPAERLPAGLKTQPLDQVMRWAEALDVRAVAALALRTDLPVDAIAERFADLCDRVASLGAWVQLEFSPIGGVRDLRTALTMIELADRANSGIVFDTWHFFRGDPDIELLRTVGPDVIRAVQISDAAPEVQGSLWDDTLHHRLLPGDGCFDLLTVIQVLDSIDALSWAGPEVISDAMHALPPAVAARLARERVDALVAQARSSDAPG